MLSKRCSTPLLNLMTCNIGPVLSMIKIQLAPAFLLYKQEGSKFFKIKNLKKLSKQVMVLDKLLFFIILNVNKL
jgi:hypothetical protein